MSFEVDIMDGSICQDCLRDMGPAGNGPRTCSRCKAEQAQMSRWERMMDAQAKEMRPGMLKFNNDTHVIRIERDSHGIMTVTVRDRARTEKGVDLTVTFPKKHNQGVVWTFMSGGRLSYIKSYILP